MPLSGLSELLRAIPAGVSELPDRQPCMVETAPGTPTRRGRNPVTLGVTVLNVLAAEVAAHPVLLVVDAAHCLANHVWQDPAGIESEHVDAAGTTGDRGGAAPGSPSKLWGACQAPSNQRCRSSREPPRMKTSSRFGPFEDTAGAEVTASGKTSAGRVRAAARAAAVNAVHVNTALVVRTAKRRPTRYVPAPRRGAS